MAYNRVSAMGVEHGLVNPAEQEAMRRAQMQMLMGGGGQSPAGDTPAPMATPQPEILNNVGRPAYETDYMNRQLQGAKDLQGLAGSQAMDLQKQKGADYLAGVKEQMAPGNAEADLRKQQWADLAGRRGIEEEGLRNQNFLEGAKANVLRQMLPTDLGGQGPMSSQSGPASAERLFQIMQGKDPDLQKIQTDALKQEMDAKTSLIPGATVQESYGRASPMISGDLQNMNDFIRSNNWSIKGNLPEMHRRMNDFTAKLAAMKLPPEVMTLLVNDMKAKMRAALQENGVFAESLGSDQARSEFGL